MRGGLAAAVLGAGIAAVASGQAAAADRTSLWPHIHAAADLGDSRGGTATWDASDSGTLAFNVTEPGLHAWADVPAPAEGWDLARRAQIEASVANVGTTPAEVQVWAVAARGWESVADVATLAPGETRLFVCRLRETFPDGTPKLDPGRVSGVRVLVRKAAAGMAIQVAGLAATGEAEPWTQPEGRIEVPAVVEGPAAAGRRVRYHLTGDEGTDIACLLHLPDDWRPGGVYPVIVEYPGNVFYAKVCYSTGLPDQCGIGYGMARGRGAIWVSMPFIDRQTNAIVENGWGNPDETADYCVRVVDDVCRNFGGDRRTVVLTGFSRGAIACGFIGLRNDRIAPLWKGFHLCQHYDGDGWNGATLEDALERAKRFQGRSVFHTDNSADRVKPVTDIMNVPTTFVNSGLGFHSIAMFLDDRESTQQVRRWFADLVEASRTVRP
ncbi:MAG: hypothetical protein WCR51_15070 [Planctomycetia bacterium]